jgi:hypothetical protein
MMAMSLDLQHTDDWLHYFVARIVCALEDRQVSDLSFRQWMDEAVADLSAFAHEAVSVKYSTPRHSLPKLAYSPYSR